MKIVILGAGQVGSTLATNLASESNDVTLVDSNEELLSELRDRLDIQTVCGWGSHPEILEQAGIEDADMLVAVTSYDEINMVACQIAHSLFHTPHKIARIRSEGYTNAKVHERLFGAEDMPVDVAITPEQLDEAAAEYEADPVVFRAGSMPLPARASSQQVLQLLAAGVAAQLGEEG